MNCFDPNLAPAAARTGIQFWAIWRTNVYKELAKVLASWALQDKVLYKKGTS